MVLVPPFIIASAASLLPCFATKPACFIKPLVANSKPTSIADVPIALASNLELACVGSLSNSSKYLSPAKLVPYTARAPGPEYAANKEGADLKIPATVLSPNSK